MTLNAWKISTLALAGALTFTLAGGDAIPEAEAEAQPHMRAALAQLKSAREQLDKAKPDKGGHRAKALALTKEAIDQVQKGIEHDNEN
jgi:hypothetical protein